ncbi:thiamine-binding protein [Planococcus salinus]|uniref:Thiamine-binding protein n=1 Tax=Planococcus salinus TaxID=1848460 RepID=A0A3M8PCD0_9BACL|nr:thiamine-binding protein [Planococcus salinus]RNF41252.1 thiamine-binding protein [Planococcus salinus]
MAKTLLSVQIIPHTDGGADYDSYVDKAIEVIKQSGVNYQVHPLETTMEGELSELLSIVEQMNEKLIESGIESVVSQVKILHRPGGTSMDSMTEKYQ